MMNVKGSDMVKQRKNNKSPTVIFQYSLINGGISLHMEPPKYMMMVEL